MQERVPPPNARSAPPLRKVPPPGRSLRGLPCGRSAERQRITPGYTNLGVNQTLQYTAAVTGLTNTTVTWEVSGVKGGNSTVGTISATGLYKAPATIPNASTLIEALASDKKTLAEVYVNIEPAGPTLVSASPNPIPTGNFSVTITGTGFKPGVVVSFNGGNVGATYINSTTIKTGGYWYTATPGAFQAINPGSLWSNTLSVPFKNSVQAPPQTIAPTSASVVLGASVQFTSSGATSFAATAGTITAAGLYTAPAIMPSSSAVTITATGPGGTATAAVTLQPIPPQTIAPAAASLDLGAELQFTALGATSFTATAGTITAVGLYTAPATEPASGTATITATGKGGSATAVVTIINSLPTTISPTSSTVTLGATQQFTSNGSTWSALFGTVSASGLCTAPSSLPATGKDTVTVTGPGGSATASITLQPPAPAITAAGTSGQLPSRNLLRLRHRHRLHQHLGRLHQQDRTRHRSVFANLAHHLRFRWSGRPQLARSHQRLHSLRPIRCCRRRPQSTSLPRRSAPLP